MCENRLDLHSAECPRPHLHICHAASQQQLQSGAGVPCLTWALFWSQQPARRVGMISSHHDITSTVGSQIPMEDVHSGRPSSGLVDGLGSNRTPYRKRLSDTPEKMNLPSRGIFYVHIHESIPCADGRRTSERLWTFVRTYPLRTTVSFELVNVFKIHNLVKCKVTIPQ